MPIFTGSSAATMPNVPQAAATPPARVDKRGWVDRPPRGSFLALLLEYSNEVDALTRKSRDGRKDLEIAKLLLADCDSGIRILTNAEFEEVWGVIQEAGIVSRGREFKKEALARITYIIQTAANQP